VGLCATLAIAAWIFLIPLHSAPNYDEGNYLAALTDLRHGFVLGKDVYADQPPGWYALLGVFAHVFGNSLTGVRLGVLIMSLVAVGAAWACGRRFGPLPALGAAALLVVSPPFPAQATQIEADTPAAALAVLAIALALWGYRGRGSILLATLAGVVLACAVSVKLTALTAVLPLAAIALFRRRLVPWSLAGIAAVVGLEAFAYRHELRAVARGAIGQHTAALGSSTWNRKVNELRLLHFLNWHTPMSWLVVVAAAGSIWLALTRSTEMRRLGALWIFAPATAAFILFMKPLLQHHLVILAVGVGVPAGTALGMIAARLGRRAQGLFVLVAAVFVGAGVYQQHSQLTRSNQPEPAWVIGAASWMRAEARPDEVVATDIPIIAYDAHRLLVPDLVDTSFTRAGVGDLTPARVFSDIDRYHVRVAAIGRAFYADTALRNGFTARFTHVIVRPDIVLLLGRRRP
jgi:4-amino-4-deoxy-L-arabinose transferase-like glycosyltransferase